MYRHINDNLYQNLESTAFIPRGSREWGKVEEWLEKGNKPEPKYTLDQLREVVKDAVASEGRKRIDAFGPSDSRAQRRALSKAINLLRKETKGQLSDPAELDALDNTGDKIEENEVIIETAWEYLDGLTSETDRSTLEAYNPIGDPGWTI
jgi:hypothetical protein